MKRTSFNLSNHAHYLTFSCYRKQQLLTDGVLCRKLLSCWDEARRMANFAIWAYVIMPEHVHLLIWQRQETYEMSKILRALKAPFTRWVVGYWSSSRDRRLNRITLRRGSRVVHRFWQEGGGYDRNLYKWESIDGAIQYIENNPVRRRLVISPELWPWSSARCRLGNDDALLAVDDVDVVCRGNRPLDPD
jgi:putative transposase